VTSEETKLLIEAVACRRDTQFADLVVQVIGLAAETHPDILRNALGRVFALKQIEEDCRRVSGQCAAMWSEWQRVRADIDLSRTQLKEMREVMLKMHRWITANQDAIVAAPMPNGAKK